jgi:putative membrane protein
MASKTKGESDRILVLCVDRDGDIGTKGRVNTPVIGRDENIKAAIELALNDPEEADTNAIFDAVKIFDDMKKTLTEPKEKIEVASISGSHSGGVEADRKLASELESILERFPANNAILVSDGYGDESVIPIIESRVPIMSIKRTVVKHSESIEESWAVFFKYVRMITEDARYSRVFLGIPGILLIAFFFLWYYQQLIYTGQALLIILGVILLVKGFALDQRIKRVSHYVRTSLIPTPLAQIKFFTSFAGFVLVLIGSYQAISKIIVEVQIPLDLGIILANLPLIIGKFITYALDLITIGVGVFFIGRSIYYLFIENSKLWRNVIGAVMVLPSREVALRSSLILLNPSVSPMTLVASVGFGILVTAASVFIVRVLSRRYSNHFRKDEHGEEE